jgi:hypothetical protein
MFDDQGQTGLDQGSLWSQGAGLQPDNGMDAEIARNNQMAAQIAIQSQQDDPWNRVSTAASNWWGGMRNYGTSAEEEKTWGSPGNWDWCL